MSWVLIQVVYNPKNSVWYRYSYHLHFTSEKSRGSDVCLKSSWWLLPGLLMPFLPSPNSCTPDFFFPLILRPAPSKICSCLPSHCHYPCSDFIATPTFLTNFPASHHSSSWPKLSFWNKICLDYSPLKTFLVSPWSERYLCLYFRHTRAFTVLPTV